MAELEGRWQFDVLGSSLTTMKVGGLIHAVSRPAALEELQADIAEAQKMNLPVRVLGAGSNVILPDAGFKGLVIIPSSKVCEVFTPDELFIEDPLPSDDVRYRTQEGFLNLSGGDKRHEGEVAYVRMAAGVPWGQAVIWSLSQGLVGLQWYARIPCNVGGAVYNNIHGEKHFVAEVVQEVRSVNMTTGALRAWRPSELHFSYDFSSFHAHKDEVIWDVTWKLHRVSVEEVAEAKAHYLEWTKAKTEVQPSGANCGSVFQNIKPEEADRLGTGMTAAGWYVDNAGCLGWEEGDMQVYPTHGNFIINRGMGTQGDFLRLVQRVRQNVQEKYGVVLMPEVECITETGEAHAW
jgi:UDP-N-acetylmuramate dehydrogenase